MEVMHTSELGKTVGQSVLSHHEVLYGAREKCANVFGSVLEKYIVAALSL
jgi:hypothetical protein